MRLFRVALIALASTTVVPYHVAEATAQQLTDQGSKGDFLTWVQSLKAGGAEVTTGTISYEPTNDTVRVSGLLVLANENSTSPTQIKIGDLTLSGFSNSGNGVQISSAVADDIEIGTKDSADAVGTKFKRLELSGVYFPQLTSLVPNASRPITTQVALLRMLTKATAKSVVANGVAFSDRFSSERIALEAASDGKIEKIIFDGLNTYLRPSEGTRNDTGQLFAKSVILDHLNIAPYLRLFEDTAYLEAGSSRPWSNLVDEVSFSNVHVTLDSAALSFDQAKLGALKVRQFERNITDVFDQSLSDPEYLSTHPDARELITEAFRSSIAVEKSSVVGAVIELNPRSDGSKIELANGTMTDVTAGHIGSLSLANLSYMEGIVSAGVEQLSIVNIALPITSQSDDAAKPNDAAYPTIGNVNALGFNAKFGSTIVGVEKFDLAMSYFIGATPTNVRASVDNLKFPTEQVAIPGLRESLEKFGYKDIDLSLQFSGTWQDAASAIAFDTIALTGVDMGKLSLSGSLTGITRESFMDPKSVLPTEAANGGIQNLRLSFENTSLFDRFISELARQNGKTNDELKLLLSTNMSAIMTQIDSPAIKNKFTLAAVSFINNPKILDIFTTTSDVVPVAEIIPLFGQPYKLPGLLKLDASANGRR